MRFVLVNGRTPCRRTFCTSCSEPIETSYLRDIGSKLPFCDHSCYDPFLGIPLQFSAAMPALSYSDGSSYR